MSQDVESSYDRFLETVYSKLQKIDPNLVLKVIEYERKFPDVNPAVSLHIHYKVTTDREIKSNELRAKYGYCVAREDKDVIFAQGNMNLKTLEQISNDPDVEELTGFASIASY